MLADKRSNKKRVISVLESTHKAVIKQKDTKRSQHSTVKVKNKRQKRFCSVKVDNHKEPARKIVVEEEKPLDLSSAKAVKLELESLEVIEPKSNQPHFMTVADLTSGDFIQGAQSEEHQPLTPINQYQEESTIKADPSPSNLSQLSPLEQEKQLDQTIGKLKSKQETIDILNKTIQTRLVQASPLKLTSANKMDIYQVQMNYYVERITHLQKELHEKNKMLAGMTEKNAQFNTLVKNNRKLLGENHRLREQRQLLERQNQALKKIVLKKLNKKQ